MESTYHKKTTQNNLAIHQSNVVHVYKYQHKYLSLHWTIYGCFQLLSFDGTIIQMYLSYYATVTISLLLLGSCDIVVNEAILLVLLMIILIQKLCDVNIHASRFIHVYSIISFLSQISKSLSPCYILQKHTQNVCSWSLYTV